MLFRLAGFLLQTDMDMLPLPPVGYRRDLNLRGGVLVLFGTGTRYNLRPPLTISSRLPPDTRRTVYMPPPRGHPARPVHLKLTPELKEIQISPIQGHAYIMQLQVVVIMR